MARTVQLRRHDACCLLRLKSGQLIANQTLEFCYSYDYELNRTTGLVRSSPICLIKGMNTGRAAWATLNTLIIYQQ